MGSQNAQIQEELLRQQREVRRLTGMYGSDEHSSIRRSMTGEELDIAVSVHLPSMSEFCFSEDNPLNFVTMKTTSSSLLSV